MPESYITLWANDWVKWLQRAKDAGPLEVIFGGPHISLPTIARVQPGDRIFAAYAARGTLNVVGFLDVERIVEPEAYVEQRLGIKRSPDIMWNKLRTTLPDAGEGVGHRIPRTCADQAAIGTGSALRWDRGLLPSTLEALRFGPRPGKEAPLKGIEGGLLKSSGSLSGHVRRTSIATAELLSHAVQGEP